MKKISKAGTFPDPMPLTKSKINTLESLIMPNPIRWFFSHSSSQVPANHPESNPNPPEEGPSMQAGPSERRIPPHSSLQTALLAQVASRPKSKKEYVAEWKAWAKQSNQAPNENRKKAVNLMMAWLENDEPHMQLNFKALRLTNLPSLPASLQSLVVSDNPLTNLPSLPASLQSLIAYDNRLTNLPSLPASLRSLHVLKNQLTSLPEDLPASLQNLIVGDNRLTSLPPELGRLTALKGLNLSSNQLNALPDSIRNLRNLRRLDLSDNRFTTVPDVLLDLPPTTEVFLTGNPIPPNEIRRVRAELQRRLAQGLRAPQLALPEIEGDDNLDDALRNAAQAGFNVHARGLTANIARRLNVLAKQFPDHLVGDTAAQHTEMHAIQQRLQQAFLQYGSSHLQLKNAQSMAKRMFATGLGERHEYYNDFRQSAGHVLSYVFLALEAQWKKTPDAHSREAHTKGIAQLIDRLASGNGFCDTRLIEEVFQIVEMPLSEYAQSHPEVITRASIPLSRTEVREVTLPLAKKILKQVMQQPDAEEDEKHAFHTALLDEMRQHPAITPEQLVSYLNEEIFMDWDTFKEVARAE